MPAPGSVNATGTLGLARTRSKSISSGLPARQLKTPILPPSPGFAPQRTMPKSASNSAIPKPPRRSASPVKTTPTSVTVTRKQSPAPEQKASTSRLNFFSRARKNSHDAPEMKPAPNKLQRHGPAAGTGYEGYGPFGKASRGRSSSATSTGTTPRSRSGSATSTQSRRDRSGSRPGSRTSNEGEVDEYFMQRLNPVVIVGGGGAAGVVPGTPSSTAVNIGVTESPGSVSMSRTGSDRSFLEASTLITSRDPSPATSERRRPSPINTGLFNRPSPSPVSSVVSAASARKHSFDTPKIETKSAVSAASSKGSRWNFFGRHKAATSAAAESMSAPPTLDPTLPTMTSVPMVRDRSTSSGHGPMPHYAMLSQEEQKEAAELVNKLQELRTARKEGSPNMGVTWAGDGAEEKREEVRRRKAEERRRLQENEVRKGEELDVAGLLNFEFPWTAPGVMQVGEGHPEEVDPLDNTTPAEEKVPTPRRTPVLSEKVPPQLDEQEPSQVRIVVQEPEEEEEDWPEYENLDEFFGEQHQPEPEQPGQTPMSANPTPTSTTNSETVMFSSCYGVKRSNTTASTTSSLGAPFQYDRFSQKPFHCDDLEDFEIIDPVPASGVYTHDSPTLRPIPSADLPNLPVLTLNSAPPPSSLPHTPTTLTKPIPPALATPGTPFSITSFLANYTDTSPPPPPNNQNQNHRHTPSSTSTSSILTATTISSLSLEADEMKLRPWALLASRWLSFDRILYSPTHELLLSPPPSTPSPRILVIDGLGTDDWSFYVALSYPKAKIYNLTSTPTTSTRPGSFGSIPASPSVPRPSNHKQVYHPSFAAAFPFPKGFFDAVCVRFLPGGSGRWWGLVVGEAKRVLTPGGRVEVAVLDCGLVGAGQRGERAVGLVRGIMERECEVEGRKTSWISKPASERMLKLLSRKGFEDVSKCFVGLPVVGSVENTDKNENRQSSQDTAENAAEGKKHGYSSGEKDRTSPENPESVNEVVSKVGRWWYMRTYERMITEGGEKRERSMWNDRKLLRECGKRGTVMRLLMCYATKPTRGGVASAGGGMVVAPLRIDKTRRMGMEAGRE